MTKLVLAVVLLVKKASVYLVVAITAAVLAAIAIKVTED